MDNKVVIGIVIVAVLIGGFFLFKNKSVAPTEVETEVVNTPQPSTTKDFSIEASNFKFTPATMSVNLGDTVRITLRNATGTHDLKIDEYNLATSVLDAGEFETVTFIANKAGTFQYYCSVGNHRAMGMVGTLTVN